MISPSAVRESVRRRPGMYLGFTDARGIHHAIYELAANGIDQFLAGKCTTVLVETRGDFISVQDDGPGFPLDQPSPDPKRSLGEFYLTEFHNSPTADGHAPHMHFVPNGVGVSVVNFLSETFTVHTNGANGTWQQSYERGIPLGPPEQVAPLLQKGTKITFTVDPAIFSERQPRNGFLRGALFDTVHLFPGLKLGLNEERFHAPEGLVALAEFYGQNDWSKTFHLDTKYEDLIIRAVAVGSVDYPKTEQTAHSWVNGSRTRLHGTHVKGFRDALRRVKWKPSVILIHTIMLQPQYAGPCKDELSTPHVRKQVRDCLLQPLQQWASENNAPRY